MSSYLGPNLWTSVTDEYKNLNSFQGFRLKIKSWVPENYSRALCKTYIHQDSPLIGFLKFPVMIMTW